VQGLIWFLGIWRKTIRRQQLAQQTDGKTGQRTMRPSPVGAQHMHPSQRQPTGKRRIEAGNPQGQPRPRHAAVKNRNLAAQMGEILTPGLMTGLMPGSG
jgi:ABC-type nickel/cobalt efflux system permease component RcnA